MSGVVLFDSVLVGSAASPFDPVRVVEARTSVAETSRPENFDQLMVTGDEAGELIVDRDHPETGRGKTVDDYRGAHVSRVAPGDVRRRPAELRKVRQWRTIETDGPHGV